MRKLYPNQEDRIRIEKKCIETEKERLKEKELKAEKRKNFKIDQKAIDLWHEYLETGDDAYLESLVIEDIEEYTGFTIREFFEIMKKWNGSLLGPFDPTELYEG